MMVSDAAFSVMIVGGGGREHAIAWKCKQSPKLGRLVVAPGNAGTAQIAENVPMDADDIDALVLFAQDQAIDLVIVGPEVPLAAGLVDRLADEGIAAFGPRRDAARIESSKAFSKQFMLDQGIPTAAFATFTALESALEYLDSVDYQVVVKADGLAAGKGVLICETVGEAQNAVRTILDDGAFGEAGNNVIIEERLTGPEVSLLAFCDGMSSRLMPTARDYKRALDGDRGLNTGGMGAFSPVSDLNAEQLLTLKRTVIQPVLDGLSRMGSPYVGVLYAGLMLTPQGPRVLEYNCRLGDPETQVILPQMETDLLDVVIGCINGDVPHIDWRRDVRACVTVVAASGGYPQAYEKGKPIYGLDAVEDALVFHAGTRLDESGDVVTDGGRVLAVSALGETVSAARGTAYNDLAQIHFDGITYRSDIAQNMR